MNIELQVCSLDLARKLKELGVNKSSIFGWCHHNYGNKRDWVIITGNYNHNPFLWGGDDCKLQEQKDREIAAYTSAELIDLLPTSFECRNEIDNLESCEKVYLRIVKYLDNYHVSYFDHDDQWFSWHRIEEVKLSDALAKMLIHLIEQKLVELPE